MDCCVLTSREVGRLTHYGLLPNHEEHTHIGSKAAIQGVLNDTFDLVEGKDGRYYVTPQKMYFLRATPSGPSRMKVTQRVLSNQLVELKPLW